MTKKIAFKAHVVNRHFYGNITLLIMNDSEGNVYAWSTTAAPYKYYPELSKGEYLDDFMITEAQVEKEIDLPTGTKYYHIKQCKLDKEK